MPHDGAPTWNSPLVSVHACAQCTGVFTRTRAVQADSSSSPCPQLTVTADCVRILWHDCLLNTYAAVARLLFRAARALRPHDHPYYAVPPGDGAAVGGGMVLVTTQGAPTPAALALMHALSCQSRLLHPSP